jgi:hypothetical protein
MLCEVITALVVTLCYDIQAAKDFITSKLERACNLSLCTSSALLVSLGTAG